MRHIVLGGPAALPTDVLSCFPSRQRPSFSEIQELAGNGQLHTTDDVIVLLVHMLTPPPPPNSQRPVWAYVLFIKRRVFSYLHAATHTPLSYAGLPFDGFLPPQHHAHPANARTFY